MANEEQLSILKQGVEVWNKWRENNPDIEIDLIDADLSETDLRKANLRKALLFRASLHAANLIEADLREAILWVTDFQAANLSTADFREASLIGATLKGSNLNKSVFSSASVGAITFDHLDLSEVIGLENVIHEAPSDITLSTLMFSRGKIPENFLSGCGLNDWEIEEAKLYNPSLSNDEVNKALYRVYELRGSQALQISPLFVSYSHANSEFVDKVGKRLTKEGIRFWRDIHDMKSGRLEKQIDRAMRLNPTVLLVLSKNSLSSDWVEHEVHNARGLEKEMGRDVLCPVALDDSWKNSRWPKRVMEQIMEYNILDFSEWEDDSRFEDMFRKLIDGLQLFYKGEDHGE